MSSMEERIREALEEHASWDSNYQLTEMTCYCGWTKQLEPMEPSAVTFRAHMASAVAGIVREAQEAAWEDGHKTKARFPYGKRGLGTDDNPYRKDDQ